jgi:hypothetical protein
VAGSKWLEGYSGQSADELLALASEYRVDSIVLAFEQALQAKSELNEAERTVLAVEAFEREVNNGGHHQFFLNTPEYAAHIVGALQRIGCAQTAGIARRAVDLLGVSGPADVDAVAAALQAGGTRLLETLIDDCDGPFFDGSDPIADRLFEYLSRNRASIRL